MMILQTFTLPRSTQRTGFIAMLVALAALLAGCESMTPAECKTADWRQIGLQDGSRGSTDRAADYYESCTKAGIVPDLALYRTGRAAGLPAYCRYGNAINEGLAGRSYEGVCPPEIDVNFRTFHGAAYRVQDTRKSIDRLMREQDRMQRELGDKKTPDDRRRTLRDQLSRGDRQLWDVRNNLRDAEYQLERMTQDLRARGQY